MSSALAGGIIAGLGTLAGAGISAASSASNTATALSNSKEENERQRNWAEQQATIANQRNMENWREQFSAQSEQALKMFDVYNSYNTPSAVVQRLRDAGFNPAAYFQGSSGQGMSNFTNLSAPSSSPAPAAVPSAGMMAFNTQPSTLNFTEAFEGLARAYESFASAREKTSNSQRTTALLGAELKLMIEKSKNQELLNAFQEVENWYQKQNLPNRIERALQETEEIASKVVFNKSASEYNDSKTLTEAFKRLNLELDHELKGEELTRSKTLTRYFEAQLLTHLDAERAAAEESRASASLSTEKAQTESDTRPFVVSQAASEASIKSNEAAIDDLTRVEKWNSVRARLRADKTLSEKEKQEAENILSLAHDYAMARTHDAWRRLDSAIEIAKKKFPAIIGFFK